MSALLASIILNDISKNLSGKNQTSKQKSQRIIENITFITPEVKERIVELFFARSTLMHTIRFAKWLLEMKQHSVEQVSLF